MHDEQLLAHGGGVGIHDIGLLQSAMARPENLANYGKPDVFDLAAGYAFGIAKNHPFIDGNKRTAFVVMETFLILNGCELNASDAECVTMFVNLAAGNLSEEGLAAWLRVNC
ncbi:MAG: death on curing protein [Hyphomonadaceae bacterium]|nr:MAG: death on curing protein [Hyphomonadaceae bacterium]KAF0184959.1 MAG: death on curing protein [Hyphomonadaceae bacterium]